MYRAIIFDLFETLITEWGHPKYTKAALCQELGINPELAKPLWKELDEDRYSGKISFVNCLLSICQKCDVEADPFLLAKLLDKRVKSKEQCFASIDPEIFQMISHLKSVGFSLAIISNCSSEEVQIIKSSKLYPYFDQVLLSYELQIKKPDSAIYLEAANRLGVKPEECLYIGDGGSRELEGAKSVGMDALQAKWFTDQYPVKRETIEGFRAIANPLDILQYIY